LEKREKERLEQILRAQERMGAMNEAWILTGKENISSASI
jgi:hypothetical protein